MRAVSVRTLCSFSFWQDPRLEPPFHLPAPRQILASLTTLLASSQHASVIKGETPPNCARAGEPQIAAKFSGREAWENRVL